MKYENIFFDFDGTLVNTVEGTAASAKYALEQLSINTSHIEDLGKIFCGPPLKESFSKFGLSDEEIENAIINFRKYQSENTVELSKIYDGIQHLLEQLKKSCKTISIVTLKSKETTIKILKFLDIYQYFDNVIGICKDFQKQNKQEMLELALENVDHSKSIMIGDRKSDIIAGNYCKIDTIAVLYGMDTKKILSTANPTYYAKNPEEIYNIINNLRRE